MARRYLITIFFNLLLSAAIAQKKDCQYKLQLRVDVVSNQSPETPNNPVTEVPQQPAEGAEIFVEANHVITYVNTAGWANLNGLCSPAVTIEISYLGKHHHLLLQTQTAGDTVSGYTHIVLSNNEPVVKWVADQCLIPHKHDIQAISLAMIKAKSSTQGDVLRSTQLQALPLQNLARSLEPLPMAQTLSTGMGIGKPVVQGMFGQRLPILNNGFRVEGQTWGLDHAPETDLWGAQQVVLLRGTEALAIGADAWGNAINLINQYDFHQYNRDYTQMIALNSNGGGIQVAGRYIKGRENQSPRPKRHPYGKGHYWLYSGKMVGHYSTPTHRLSNTASREASLSHGNLWNSERGYWGLKARAEREFHLKVYGFQSGIFSESHIGNVADLLAAMQRSEPLADAKFGYGINRPMQQAIHMHGSYNNKNYVLNKYIIHHKFSLQSNQRWEFDPHRSQTVTFAQLNLWQGTINQYTGFQKLKPSQSFTWKWVFQNSSQWQRYGGYYFLPDFQQWQPNLHCHISHNSPNQIQHVLVMRTDLLIRNAFPKTNGQVQNLWDRKWGKSAAYSLTKIRENQQFQLHISQLWRAPSVNELYTRGVHHGAAAYEQGNPLLKPESGQKVEALWVRSGKQNEFRFTGFYQQSNNFIALFPMESPILTVRGAFPAYEYKQLPTKYMGAELQWNLQWPTKRLSLLMKASGIYARIKQNNELRFPNFLPCPKASIQLQKQWQQATFTLESIAVGKQPFYTVGSDFLAPPSGYVLLNAQLLINTKGHDQHAHWVIYGENLGNKAYRDYLDRFRYFTNQAGWNVGVKWLYDVHHHNEHRHEPLKTGTP